MKKEVQIEQLCSKEKSRSEKTRKDHGHNVDRKLSWKTFNTLEYLEILKAASSHNYSTTSVAEAI